MLKRLLLLLCLASPAIVAAEEPEARWFDIEILVFKRAQLSSENFEQWPQDPGRPSTDTAASLLPVASSNNTDPYHPVPFQLLPSRTYQLSESLEKMQASDNYKPLVHLAWRQPTYDKDKALPVLIKGGELITQQLSTSADTIAIPTQTNEIEGTITVSVKRYLHLAADLLLHDPSVAVESVATPLADQTQPVSNPSAGMRSYRMIETRRMRSTEVHYIDHPAFGILAVITPHKLPEPPAPIPVQVIETPAPAVTQ